MPAAESPAKSRATETSPTTASSPATAGKQQQQQQQDDPSDIIDMAVFGEIQEMDDDDSHDFSRAIVEGFLDQATETFDSMDKALDGEDLEKLSELGHFLKGSSATLGLKKVKDECEKIQHFGQKKDDKGENDVPDEKVCLDNIDHSLKEMKHEYEKVKRYFANLYPPED